MAGVNPLEVEWATVGVPFEPALFDLAGKAQGLPAHKLMGPKRRDRIPVGYTRTLALRKLVL